MCTTLNRRIRKSKRNNQVVWYGYEDGKRSPARKFLEQSEAEHWVELGNLVDKYSKELYEFMGF